MFASAVKSVVVQEELFHDSALTLNIVSLGDNTKHQAQKNAFSDIYQRCLFICLASRSIRLRSVLERAAECRFRCWQSGLGLNIFYEKMFAVDDATQSAFAQRVGPNAFDL